MLEPIAAFAQTSPKPPQSAFSVVSPFKKNFTNDFFFDGAIVDVSANEVAMKPQDEPAPLAPDTVPAVEKKVDTEKLLGRVDRQAPEEFQNMVVKFREGDIGGANAQADAFVGYMMNLMFEVRELTNIIGAALVRQGVIDEEAWVGVGQYLDYEMAQAREENATPLKPTHDKAMERIVADANGQVEVFYFFTLNSKWSRQMAPDVERLWRVAQKDPRIKMVALTLGPQPQAWIDSYREYTGLTIPIMEGAEVARAFNVKFVPSLVVVTPSNKAAYLKTGQQSFDRMLEFVKTAQGEKLVATPELLQIANAKIGQVELSKDEREEKLARKLGILPSGNPMQVRARYDEAPNLEKF